MPRSAATSTTSWRTRLSELIATTGVSGLPARDSASHAVSDLLHEIVPRVRLASLHLADDVAAAAAEIIEEQHRSELLRSHNIEPRNRVLLEGAPGNGKTSLAEAIAAESMLPFYAVRYEGIVSSFLGETAGRIDQVFEFARTRRCVLFFDEFDTIAKERADEHETGEIKRVVSTLLLQIDRLPSHVIVVAATNHGELLDRAAWRRFQLRLALQPPSRGRRRVPRRPTDTVRRRARSRAVYPRRPPAWCQLRRARAVRPGRPPPVRARAARRRPDRDREEPAEPVADPGPPMTRERR